MRSKFILHAVSIGGLLTINHYTARGTVLATILPATNYQLLTTCLCTKRYCVQYISIHNSQRLCVFLNTFVPELKKNRNK
jgi:hypothetical protein